VRNGADAVESRLRHTVLETINRLPNNEALRPYVTELLRLATDVLSCDNEDNSLTCLRIIFDLHKNFRPSLEAEVQSFLNLVQRIYSSLPIAMSQAFSVEHSNTSEPPCDLASMSPTKDRMQIPLSSGEGLSPSAAEAAVSVDSCQVTQCKLPQPLNSHSCFDPVANDRFETSSGELCSRQCI